MIVANEKADAALVDLADQADPIASVLIQTIAKMQPHPTPLVAAMACRLVGLFAAKVMMDQAASAADTEAVLQGFDYIDERLSARAMASGSISFNEPAASAGRVSLTALADDPTLFDIDAWEECKP